MWVPGAGWLDVGWLVGWLVKSCSLARSKCYVIVLFNSIHIFYACRSLCSYAIVDIRIYMYSIHIVVSSSRTVLLHAGPRNLRIWFGRLDQGVGKVWLAMPRRHSHRRSRGNHQDGMFSYFMGIRPFTYPPVGVLGNRHLNKPTLSWQYSA